MKKLYLYLPFLLLTACLFTACEEVKEENKYANWRQRNQAFIDSIRTETGNNVVATGEAADAVVPGDLFAIRVQSNGTANGERYVYCKKLIANTTGERPVAVGYHSTVETFYYGTYFTGDRFDGNFKGYGALDQHIPLPPEKEPTEFESPTKFSVSGVVEGWKWALQFMRKGERWMLYIPWESGYGESDYSSSSTIPGCSVLTFDVILTDVL